MPFIQNISKKDVTLAHHFDPGPNSMLIQVVDPATTFPNARFNFRETHRFEFLDIEEDGLSNLGDGTLTNLSEFRITDEQATEIARLLVHALNNRMNVIVHCQAGICRSGAIAEVGVTLGFQDTETFRSPNLLVKHKLLKALGMSFDANELHTINGV